MWKSKFLKSGYRIEKLYKYTYKPSPVAHTHSRMFIPLLTCDWSACVLADVAVEKVLGKDNYTILISSVFFW